MICVCQVPITSPTAKVSRGGAAEGSPVCVICALFMGVHCVYVQGLCSVAVSMCYRF